MSLHYAETHFKFKLPWSPLWRPWPEVFLDAPSFCLPQLSCPIFLVVKDAHLFPIEIVSLKWTLSGPDGNRQGEWEPRIKVESPLQFLDVPCELPSQPGLYRLHALIRVKHANGREREFWQGNYPFLPPQPLEIRRLEHGLPYPTGWQAGEMHCHSDYSSDPVEFGAPLAAMQAAGTALGLDFIQVTDHSYDFCYRKEAYMEACDPLQQFRQYQAEVAQCNAASQGLGCTLIAGEEVSCGNAQGENVHLLVMGPGEYLPGLGDGGRRGLKNKPDLKIEEVLERLSGIPCFAAHPRVRIGRLERFIFRRGPWSEVDLGKPKSVRPNFRGLQFWNGGRSVDFLDGRRFWVESLLKGHRFLPIGANDAHGDFNQNVGVKFPLFSLYRGRNHVLGKVRTLFPAPKATLDFLQKAALGTVCTATDGPFLSLTAKDKGFHLSAQSNEDFGVLKKVQVVGGKVGQRQETRLMSQTPGSMTFEADFEHSHLWDYARAEVETMLGRFALSSAIFKP